MTISGVRISLCECARPIPDIDTGDCVKCGRTLAGLKQPTADGEGRQVRRKPPVVRAPAPVPAAA